MSNNPIKIMVVGGSTVGKTSIVRRANHESLVDVYIPAYNEDKINVLEINDQTINFAVMEMPGGDFSKLRFILYKSTSAFIFVIDIANHNSIAEFERFYQEIKNEFDNNKKDVVFTIAINKVDLRNKDDTQYLIPKEELKELENKYNCQIIEISAIEDINIEELFKDTLQKYINYESTKNKAKQSKKDNKDKCIID